MTVLTPERVLSADGKYLFSSSLTPSIGFFDRPDTEESEDDTRCNCPVHPSYGGPQPGTQPR